MSETKGRQVGGDHYTRLKFQPWDVLPDWLDGWMNPFQAYLVGNILKYLARAPWKGARLNDARKAQHYLDELVGILTRDAVLDEVDRNLAEIEALDETPVDPKFDIRPADTRDVYP